MKRYVQFGGALAALTLSLNAQAFVIDLFTDPALQTVSDVVNGAGGTFNQSPGPHASIVGGYRDLFVDAISGAVDQPVANGVCDPGDACSELTVAGGVLSFSNDSPSVNGVAEVQWDGNDNSSTLDYTGLGGLDFVDQVGCPPGGCDRFTFNVLAADLGFNFAVGVYTDSTHFTEFNLVSDGSTGVDTLFFADFTDPFNCGLVVPGVINSVTCGAGGVVDFTDVGAMRLVLNTQDPGIAAVDLAIEGITKTGIPEPGTLALLGAGFAAAGRLARRRRRKDRVA